MTWVREGSNQAKDILATDFSIGQRVSFSDERQGAGRPYFLRAGFLGRWPVKSFLYPKLLKNNRLKSKF